MTMKENLCLENLIGTVLVPGDEGYIEEPANEEQGLVPAVAVLRKA